MLVGGGQLKFLSPTPCKQQHFQYHHVANPGDIGTLVDFMLTSRFTHTGQNRIRTLKTVLASLRYHNDQVPSNGARDDSFPKQGDPNMDASYIIVLNMGAPKKVPIMLGNHNPKHYTTLYNPYVSFKRTPIRNGQACLSQQGRKQYPTSFSVGKARLDLK